MSKANDIATYGQYQPQRKNAIINGNFNIWQRGTSFAAATNGSWTADRMQALRVGVGFFDVDKTTDHPLVSGGSCCEVTVSTIDASLLTSDNYGFQTKVEGYDYQRLHQNVCTLSFWVKSNIIGTYYASFTNEGGPPSHSYVADYTIDVADTWEKKTITFTPGTVGTFNLSNGEGLRVRWSLGDGSTSQTATLNAWQAGNYRSGTSSADFMGTLNNSFRLTDVQLEVGDEATDFEFRHFGEELALCQRYYEKSYDYDVAPGTASVSAGLTQYQTRSSVLISTAGTLRIIIPFRVNKRATAGAFKLYAFDGTADAVRIDGGANNRSGCTITSGNVGETIATSIAVDNSSANQIGLDNLIDFQWTVDAEL